MFDHDDTVRQNSDAPVSKREARKALLLERGLEVMKVHGYNGTSVKDIVDAADMPKGSFYNYFASKEDFAVAALEQVGGAAIEDGMRLLGDASRPPLERLQSFFLAQTEQACAEDFRAGCFLGNLGQEMSDSCEAIRCKVQQTLSANARMFGVVLEQARAAGQLAPAIDPAQTAEFLFNAWEGTLMRMKADKSRAPLDAFLALLPRLLEERQAGSS